MDLLSANPGELGGPTASGLELRDALGGKFKDVDDKTHQVLVEFPHETVDSFKTVFGNRAFADSFEARLPTMCWQHDIRNPIGHATEAQVTPKVNEIRGQFDDFDAVPDAKRAFHQIQSGTISDFSFGFKGAKFERADGLGKGVRRITHAFMAEFSPVTIGSIPGAQATGLREDTPEIMEIGHIIYLRDEKLVDDTGFRELLEEHHPELAGRIIALDTRDKKGNDADADDNSGAVAEDIVDPVEWTAVDAGLHTAFGPNKEAMRVNEQPDGSAKWNITDTDGNKLADGEAEDAETAKAAAMGYITPGTDEDDELGERMDAYEVPDYVTAADIRDALADTHPGLAYALRSSSIVLTAAETTLADPHAAAALVITADAALDSGLRWIEDFDTRELPDEVNQALALMNSARVSMTGVMEALALEGERAEDDLDPDLLDSDLLDGERAEDEDDPDADATYTATVSKLDKMLALQSP